MFAASDLVVSRAGANAVFEFLALAKPMLLIPLPASASRGDQVLNAGYFTRKGYALSLEQEDLTPETLLEAVNELAQRRLSFTAAMSAEPLADGTDEVLAALRGTDAAVIESNHDLEMLRTGPYPVPLKRRSPDADTKRIMAAIVDCLPDEARVRHTPTEEELLATFPPGYKGDPNAEVSRRPGTDT